MRIGVMGINHKLADLNLRENLAKACQHRFSADRSAHGDHSLVLLSTCNRTEIYFFSEDLAETHSYLLSILRHEVNQDFDQKLYSFFGFDCFLHLSRVTAGLDSAIVAETEIQGQVKNAYENTLAYRELPHELHYLFQKSLKIGKKVRFEVPLKPGLPDLEDAIYHIGKKNFGSLYSKILFVGCSAINLKILKFLKQKKFENITICNRTNETAQTISKELLISYMPWEQLRQWVNYDWIILGTKSPGYLLTKDHLRTPIEKKKVLIDLCVPRNIDPFLGIDSQITLLNIDQINHSLIIRQKKMYDSLSQAEEIVLDAAKQLAYLFRQREIRRMHLIAS